MTLRQLRYIHEVASNGFSISAAARRLHTSQPGISKQILALEDELGIRIFQRSGRHLDGLTEGGHQIADLAADVLRQSANIRQLASEYRDERIGSLSIATTHTQSRYVLPPVIRRFIERYPGVALHMQQGTPRQIAGMAARGDADLAIATEAMELFSDLVMVPCYRWNRAILVPSGHPLLDEQPLTLEAVARYPLVTYVFGFTGRSQLDAAFSAQGLSPRVVFTAADADVIKTYVKLGLGVGIIASMAFEPERDTGLTAMDASHLFDYSTTRVGFQRGALLRGYMFDFIAMFAPHLERRLLEQALACRDQRAVDALFTDVPIPVYSGDSPAATGGG